MSRFPRAGRNARIECECGAAVVKRGDDYVCVECGERSTEEAADEGGASTAR
ncbi:hypothetical protein I7X12_04895 [Halosimplex litoreum]|uniref:Uncharacterized protein n=1 Tax=Halosimplex litoreum TaxID=1198301 RepID=A0A7T3KW56_9EURY|nr:hypothetical protein [Halosimplex litoreum]QPV63972.1 hypothetical protein I7X12_04895 [Halosimplex litoreum]